MPIRVDISPGELIDKITILEIKLERIADPTKRENVRVEYTILMEVFNKEIKDKAELRALIMRLKEINGRLWTIENNIRDNERTKTFDQAFIALARSVYRANDERAAVKRAINDLLDSRIIEEKSYTPY